MTLSASNGWAYFRSEGHKQHAAAIKLSVLECRIALSNYPWRGLGVIEIAKRD